MAFESFIKFESSPFILAAVWKRVTSTFFKISSFPQKKEVFMGSEQNESEKMMTTFSFLCEQSRSCGAINMQGKNKKFNKLYNRD